MNKRYKQGELKFLYKTKIGLLLLNAIVSKRWFSIMYGIYYNSFLSKNKIKQFSKQFNHNIDEKNYKSFNDFFTRQKKIKKPRITYNNLQSPCDGMLSTYHITSDLKFEIKGNLYSVSSLVNDKKLALSFEQGLVLVFRLRFEDYHRYHHIDKGRILETKKISGKYHSVDLDYSTELLPLQTNYRIVNKLLCDNFKECLYIQVGALVVGKIHNHQITMFDKFDEMGYFSFGASTIVLLFKKNVLNVKSIYFQKEIEVKINDIIGELC